MYRQELYGFNLCGFNLHDSNTGTREQVTNCHYSFNCGFYKAIHPFRNRIKGDLQIKALVKNQFRYKN